ncbi:serum amyloid P-component-like isoform 1-T2 [Aulostomus maculatus]
MKYLLPLVMLTACAAAPQDLSGKMFTFPHKNNVAHVKLTASKENFSDVTVCLRSFTDLKRDHVLFSLATPSFSNDFLIMWDNGNKELEIYVRDKMDEFNQEIYKLNMWHSICATWEGSTGLAQVWFDGQPSSRKTIVAGSNIVGRPIITIGQEQDSHGGGFSADQSFVGMMSDIHMWDYVLSPCEMQNYLDDLNFTPGNVLNWRALEFQIVDKVFIESKKFTCQ